MKFDELDKKMRVYETTHDRSVLPGLYMAARIDGRNFTKLTKDVHKFSVLFHPDIDTFDRKSRKYNSILAAEASAKFSLLLGAHAAFDCRISELPTIELVCDYFRWRNEDAHRNALNAHCYWMLRKRGESVETATLALERLSTAEKNELLWQGGINFNDLPLWQKRGVGLYWDTYEKPGRNPITGQDVTATRRRLHTDLELPMKDAYGAFVKRLIDAARDNLISEGR